MNKNEAIVASVMLFVLGMVSCIGIIFSTDTVQPQKSEEETTEIRHELECDSQISHDWECKYIVEDFYTQEVSMVHYVDEVIENVDGSITFVGEDGLVTRIPYPYYRVEKNTNKTLHK